MRPTVSSLPADEDTWKQIRNGIDQQLEETASVTDRIESVIRLGSPGEIRAVEPVILIDLLKGVRSDLVFLAEQKKIDLKEVMNRDSNDPPYISCDLLAIKEVFYNLLANAVKHNGEGTEVGFEVTRLGSDSVQVKISDDGTGIPIDILDQIFEPGIQIYQPGKLLKGTGMGLHLCKLLVELHGGRISAKNIEPHGVAFAVVLPISPAFPFP